MIALAAILATAWLLVRDSSLVAVEEVKIVGLDGYHDKAARKAVTAEATQMTTMNFDDQRVADAAAAFVNVESVSVETDYPHAVTIRFDVIRPVLLAKVNGRSVALAADGAIVTSARDAATLPKIEVSGSIEGGRVTDGKALDVTSVLGAAPDVLLRKVDDVRWGRQGLVLELDKGVRLIFGTATGSRTKWRDAATVLADGNSKGLSYIDLRAPGRPAVGGLGAAPVTVTPGAAKELPDVAAAEESTPAAEAPTTTGESAPQPAAPAQPAPTQQPAPAVGGASPGG